MSRPLTVMLVAAEASGDVLGAGLARALKARLASRVRLVGVGGPAMRAEGIESPFDIGSLSVLGMVEGLLAYRTVVRRADETAALADRERPDVAVLIDSWGFTLRVAQRLRAALPDLPLVKYVAPQVWATRPGRAKTLAHAVDLLLSTQALDGPAFEREGLRTIFVGNRALATPAAGDGPRLRAELGVAPDARLLLVLPGSRPAEIRRLMPPFGEAVRALMPTRPDLRVVLAAAASVSRQVRAAAALWPVPPIVIEGDQARADAMRAATVALACSGTVTTELAVAGCPTVVAYRVGAVTAAILRRLFQTRYITILNITAGDAIAPEFIQQDCTGPKLAAALAERLDDAALRLAQVERQNDVLERMGRGGPDPSERAADAVLDLLKSRGLTSEPA